MAIASRRSSLTVLAALALSASLPVPLGAQYLVIHSLELSEGNSPRSALVQDAAGEPLRHGGLRRRERQRIRLQARARRRQLRRPPRLRPDRRRRSVRRTDSRSGLSVRSRLGRRQRQLRRRLQDRHERQQLRRDPPLRRRHRRRESLRPPRPGARHDPLRRRAQRGPERVRHGLQHRSGRPDVRRPPHLRLGGDRRFEPLRRPLPRLRRQALRHDRERAQRFRQRNGLPDRHGRRQLRDHSHVRRRQRRPAAARAHVRDARRFPLRHDDPRRHRRTGNGLQAAAGRHRLSDRSRVLGRRRHGSALLPDPDRRRPPVRHRVGRRDRRRHGVPDDADRPARRLRARLHLGERLRAPRRRDPGTRRRPLRHRLGRRGQQRRRDLEADDPVGRLDPAGLGPRGRRHGRHDRRNRASPTRRPSRSPDRWRRPSTSWIRR